MQERELETTGGRLYYGVDGGKAYVTGYQGTAAKVEVPPRIEGCPTTGIGKKAFLSKKNLRRIVLPDTLEEVGDWAFAYCDGLLSASFPKREVRFGKAVFKECVKLGRIEVREGAAECGGCEPGECVISELLAAAAGAMDAYYLLDLREAGSEEWLAKWDARALAVLRVSDQEGYSRQVLCGEEDYGSTDLEAFASGRRKEKIRLAFLRLLHPKGISVSGRAELEAYLRSHTKGCPKEETWLVLREEHGSDRKYYELFTELGCINENNFDGILSDIGEESPEMKAFFMRRREGQASAEDFFAELEL